MQFLQIVGVNKPVARIALGTAWFTPDRKENAFSILDEYIHAGGNFFDTARIYGAYTSEDVFSEWLAKHKSERERFVILTKGCHHKKTEDEEDPKHCRVTPSHIKKDLDESLKHLGLDYVDIFLLHRDDPSVPVGPLMDALEAERVAHRIHAYGVSNWTYERILEANKYCESKHYQGITVNSPSFSLAEVTEPVYPTTTYYTPAQLLQFKTMPSVTIVAWSSQAQGFFSEEQVEREEQHIVKMSEAAVRAYHTPANEARRRRAAEVAAACEPPASSASVALAYVLTQPVPVCAVVGVSSHTHLHSALAALTLHLSASDVEYLLTGTRPSHTPLSQTLTQ